tara:strand:- start:4189 stop:5994 length:1806 start_codon:yes stop_codon:yes gene_type:complete
LGSPERYVEIASGHITNRGRADKLSNLPNLIGSTKDLHELYHSWYVFDEDIKHHLDGQKSISSFKGSYYINNIVLDIDKKNLSNTDFIQWIRYFVDTELLNDLSIEKRHIQIWFSGTGFHVVIPNLFGFTPSVTLPFSVKNTLQDVFPDCDPIYDGARLIRAPFSYNKKSGLFKIPLTIDEVQTLSFEEIQNKAKELPKIIDFKKYEFEDVAPYLKQYLKPHITENNIKPITKRSAFDIDPTTVVTCMQTVLGKSPVPGERNDTMMRLAAWLRRSGIPQPIVSQTLAEWSGNQKEAISTTESEFEKGYNYWCNDSIMSKYCDPKCIHFKRKDYSMALESAEDLALKFVDYVKKGISEKAFNLKDIYNINCDWEVTPGELMIVLGDTGMGKSTFVSNLCLALTNHKIMYLSLENNYHLTYGRMVQISQGVTWNEAVKYHRELDDVKNLYDSFDNIYFGHQSPDIDKLQEAVAYQSPHIVVVDTTDELHVKNVHNDFDRMNAIIRKLKEIATNQDCIVIAVHHVNKDSSRNGFIDINSAKGSTTVTQKADKVVSINGNSRHEKDRIWAVEKNRNGKTIRIMFEFDWDRMTFKQKAPPTVGKYS